MKKKELKEKYDEKKVFETYEIGTKVKFENMFDAKVRTGIITHWSPKHPLLYEVTCEMDRVWFVSVDMIRLD